MSEPTVSAVIANATRKAPEALPRELFPLMARNIPLLRVISSASFLITLGGALVSLVTILRLGLSGALLRFALAMIFFQTAFAITPAIYLRRYQQLLAEAAENPEGASLAAVLQQQRRYWRFISMIVLLMLAFIVIPIVVPHLLHFRDAGLG